jgi:DNA-binding transcriptional MerR regulator
MSPSDAPLYSLTEVAGLAGVTPRTVRYYMAQGLLPSPGTSGPGPKYDDGHLNRLGLIRKLQREHLPLAEIRGRLERLGDDDVRRVLEAHTVAPDTTPDGTLAYVRELMAKSGVSPRASMLREATPVYGAVYEPRIPDAFPAPGMPPAAAPGTAPPETVPSVPAPDPRAPDRSTWERHALSPDVELHIRRPLDRRTNKRVDQLVRIARELFDEP